MSFCQKLTEKERSAGRLQRDWEYTLPTEAQWEYACRAGTTDCLSVWATTPKNSVGMRGLTIMRDAVGEEYAHEVGKKLPNAWKLHDMHGNVWEWCRDWYTEKLPGGDNPEVTSKTAYRVYRGGSWRFTPQSCRSANRFRYYPGSRSDNLGFSVAAVPSSQSARKQ